MDFVNKTLLLSLKQDLRTLNESVDDINVENDLKSWLFPTKNYKFVTEFLNKNNILEINNVKLLLELIIDRLYIGIRLILTTLENTFKNESFETNYFVVRPPQMTVGCCFENLKKLVELIRDKMAEKKPSDKKGCETIANLKSKKNCKIQTDVTTMVACDSCASAIMSMKFLLNVFDVAKDDIYSVKQVRSSLHDLTQFGCMLHTTASIEKSLKQLIEKLMKADDENKQQAEKIKKLTTELQHKTGTIMLLEQENTNLNDTLKKTGVQLSILRNKISDLEISKLKNEQKIEYLSNLNEGLNSTVNMYREVNSRLRDDKNVFEESLGKSRNLLKLCAQELPIVDKKLMNMANDQQYFLNELDTLSNTLENLSSKLKKVSKVHAGMESKVKLLSSDVTENTSNLTKELQVFQEKVKEKCLQNSVKELNVNQADQKNQIKGNPIEDFSRQIEENNEKIKTLQNENKKLETILSKFKNFKK